jgi:muconate cycloisomerase
MNQLRIEAIEAILVNLPCKATFRLAGGTYSQQGQPTPRVLVKVVGSNGLIGWGEVTPCPTWCYETSETILTTIRQYLAPALLGQPAWNLDHIHRLMERLINPGATIGQPLAKSGIDTALHDLMARTLQVPLYVLLGSKRLEKIRLSYIVSAATADEAAVQARQGMALGYTAFKVKIGLHGEIEDLAHVAAVKETVPRDTFLWVDANQGYGLDNAMRLARRLAQLGVQVFEQPLKGSRISGFRKLAQLGAVPIAIDESLCSPTDLVEYIKAEAVDLPVAKVQRCGGHWCSRQFCHVAEAAGLRLIGSGLCETDLGLAHGLHLFGAFGIDLPCDLNGRQFVESAYLRETVEIKSGHAMVPERIGVGVEVDETLVRRYAV